MQYLLRRGARAAGLAGLIGALLGVVAAHPASAATTISGHAGVDRPCHMRQPEHEPDVPFGQGPQLVHARPRPEPRGLHRIGLDPRGRRRDRHHPASGRPERLGPGSPQRGGGCEPSDLRDVRLPDRAHARTQRGRRRGRPVLRLLPGNPDLAAAARTPASSTASRATGPFPARSTCSPTTTRPAGRSSDSRSSRAARAAISRSTTST